MATSLEEAIEGAKRIGYPVLVRPSYVLGGRAMVIAYDEESVVRYMKEAVEYSHDRPVLIDHFLEDAIEVDVDALSDGEDVVIGGIMQHIEEAGIHSGDSSCVLPAVDIPQPLLDRMRDYTFKLARALKVVGLMNIQFAIPRGKRRFGQWRRGRKSLCARSESARLAHRAVCFESDRRAAGEDCGAADDGAQAARIPAGKHRAPRRSRHRKLLLREVAGVSLEQISRRRHRARAGDEIHRRSDGRGRQLRRSLRQGATGGGTEVADAGHGIFISVTDHDKRHVAEVARKFVDMGFKLVATAGTADVIEAAGMNVERVYKVKEGRPNVVDFIKGQRIHLIVNTPTGLEPWFDEKAIRRAAVTARIPTITTLSAARAAAEGIAALQRGEVNIRALQHLHAERAPSGLARGRL